MNYIKYIFALIGILVLTQSGQASKIVQSDTIIIKFGNNSRIVLIIEDKDDLEALDQYDLNAMIEDLKISIEESEQDSLLKIEDSSGERYLKDTTIYIENKIVQRDQDRILDRDDDYYDDDDEDYEYYRSRSGKNRKPRSQRNYNIELGFNNYLENGNFPDESNAPYAVKPWGSWFVELNTTYKTNLTGPLYLEWGGGFDWYNFKFEDPSQRIFKTDSMVVFLQDTTSNIEPIKSKLTSVYINFKLVPMLDFSRSNRKSRLWNYHGEGFRIGFGVYGGFRIGSHSKFVFNINGDKKKDKDSSNFFLENFRYGLRGQVGYRGVDLFVNYDLSKLFSSGRGPELNAFTIGFIL